MRFSIDQDASIPNGRSYLFPFVLVTIVILIFLLPAFYLQHFFTVLHYKHTLLLRNKAQHSWNFASMPNIDNSEKVKTLPSPPKPDYAQCELLTNAEKYDCYPEDGASADACEARGCCWIQLENENEGNVPLNVPYCFYPPNYESYTYLNITETAYGLNAYLRRKYRSPYPNDVEIIKMDVRFETSTRLHIKVIKLFIYYF